MTAYEYMMGEETDEIQGWEQFIHVPDESKQKASAEKRITGERESHRQAGLLLYEKTGAKKPAAIVTFCQDSAEDAFLLCWQQIRLIDNQNTGPLERLGPPWSSSLPIASIEMETFVRDLCLSPSGRFLAVGYAAGNWTASIWDLETNQRVCRLVFEAHSAQRFLFSPDEKYLVGYDVTAIGIYSRETGERLAKYPARGPIAAMHPTGLLVVANPAGKIQSIDPLSGDIKNTVILGAIIDRRAFMEGAEARSLQMLASINLDTIRKDMTKQFGQLASHIKLDPDAMQEKIAALASQGYVFTAKGELDIPKTVEAQIDRMREDLENRRQKLATPFTGRMVDHPHVQGSEHISSLLCTGDGKWICCGTEQGVRIYAWNDVLSTTEASLKPFFKADFPTRSQSYTHREAFENRRVMGLTYDGQNDQIVYGFPDGELHAMNLETGVDRSLFTLPGNTPVWQMELSRNGQFLLCVHSLNDDRGNVLSQTVQVWNYDKVRSG